MTKLFLSKGANINGVDGDNESFLSYAIEFDHVELVVYLIENGVDKEIRDKNSVMGCLPVHSIQSVKMLALLIAKGFGIDEQCENGRNLLHFAAKDNLKEVAQYLVEKELVEISQKDENGETALDYAKKFNHLDIAKIIKMKK